MASPADRPSALSPAGAAGACWPRLLPREFCSTSCLSRSSEGTRGMPGAGSEPREVFKGAVGRLAATAPPDSSCWAVCS